MRQTPPWNEEVERAIIGTALLEPDEVIGRTIECHITEVQFYKPENAAIYKALADMYNSEEVINQVTLCDKLTRMGKLDFVGGEAIVAGYINHTCSSANLEAYIEILTEKYRARKLQILGRMIPDIVNDKPTSEVIEFIEDQIVKIQEETPKTGIISARENVFSAMTELSEMQGMEGKMTGVDTGYGRLNYICGGFQPGNLIILGGRTGQGKSSLALTFSLNAIKDGKDVLFFSLEMTATELTKRIIAQESGFNIPSIHYRKPTAEDWRMLNETAKRVHDRENQIYIDESGGLSVWEISARAKKFNRDHNLGLIVVDYIQIARGDKDGSREQEIASITRQLKALAKNLGVPILALAQVSRKVEEHGKERKPVLADLRESGAIENDADMVIFIYNPQSEQFNDDHFEYILPPELRPQEVREMIIAKHRHGATTKIFTKWNPNSAKFENIEYERRIKKQEVLR